LSTRAEQLEWRRAKVIELKARGMNHSEIARELRIARTCIVEDVQYLRNEAKKSIKEYVTDQLPEQYQVCLIALDSIIKRAFDIIETSDENREKLQAMELFKDTHTDVVQKNIIERAMVRKRLGDIYYHEGLCFQTQGDKSIAEKLEQTITEYTKAKEIFNRDYTYKVENAIVTNNLGVTKAMMRKSANSQANCYKEEVLCLFVKSLELLGWDRRYSPEYKVIEYNRGYAENL
jgi:tetratricopeptide (TPR) repeat protein